MPRTIRAETVQCFVEDSFTIFFCFIWPLYCLLIELPLMIMPLISANFSEFWPRRKNRIDPKSFICTRLNQNFTRVTHSIAFQLFAIGNILHGFLHCIICNTWTPSPTRWYLINAVRLQFAGLNLHISATSDFQLHFYYMFLEKMCSVYRCILKPMIILPLVWTS